VHQFRLGLAVASSDAMDKGFPLGGAILGRHDMIDSSVSPAFFV
jgi:hypothetical protein